MTPRKPRRTIDHDGLHKKLLTHFFQQFLEGFFPEVAAELDFTDFGPENFLTQELFNLRLPLLRPPAHQVRHRGRPHRHLFGQQPKATPTALDPLRT